MSRRHRRNILKANACRRFMRGCMAQWQLSHVCSALIVQRTKPCSVEARLIQVSEDKHAFFREIGVMPSSVPSYYIS